MEFQVIFKQIKLLKKKTGMHDVKHKGEWGREWEVWTVRAAKLGYATTYS